MEKFSVLIADRLANIEGQQCNKCQECPDNIHGSPEWWEIRPGNNRPQLLLLFSPEKSNRANYQITIPHWAGEKPTPKNPPIKDYRKGSFMSVVHLSDSSKLIINTSDEKEANRVLGKLKPIMNQGLVSGGHTNHTQIEGVNIKQQNMTCRYAVYYPKGQTSKTPLWTVKFDV
jgi:hypothetical protein